MDKHSSSNAAKKAFGVTHCCVAAMVLSLPVSLPQAAETTSVTMEMEMQTLDLDTGAVLDAGLGIPAEPTVEDVKFAYNADRVPHAVVFPAAEGVTLAFVTDVTFDGVWAEDISSLSFSAEPADVPMEGDYTAVVRTPEGAVFKLGNVLEDELSVTFDYAQLQ